MLIFTLLRDGTVGAGLHYSNLGREILAVHRPVRYLDALTFLYGIVKLTKTESSQPPGIAVWLSCEHDKLCRHSEIVRQLDNAFRAADPAFRSLPLG
jgi:hypothetical protein